MYNSIDVNTLCKRHFYYRPIISYGRNNKQESNSLCLFERSNGVVRIVSREREREATFGCKPIQLRSSSEIVTFRAGEREHEREQVWMSAEVVGNSKWHSVFLQRNKLSKMKTMLPFAFEPTMLSERANNVE